MISLATRFDTYEEWPLVATYIIVFVLIGVWLWKGAYKMAKKIVPRNVSIDEGEANDFNRPIYQLAFVLLGLYVLIHAVSDISYTVQLFFSLPDEAISPDYRKKQQAAMVSSVIELFIGLVLVVGSKGVSAAIYKIRYGGL